MVDQTKMNDRTNGRGAGAQPSTFSSTRTAARNMAHLLHDAITLAQLQLRLLVLDCQQLRTKVGVPLIVMGVGAVLTLSSVPVALAGIALIFRDVAGLTWLSAVWLTFALALVFGIVCVACGIWWLRSASKVFESSRVEWTQNIERLKEMLWRSSHPTESLRDLDERSAASARDFH
jgi:Putative Actinobacterial Holin-X, holin superfamily III